MMFLVSENTSCVQEWHSHNSRKVCELTKTQVIKLTVGYYIVRRE